MAFTDAIYADQQVVTASAVALAVSGQLSSGMIVKARASNAGNVFLGGATVTATNDGTGNGFPLAPGESVSLPINLAQVAFIIGTAGDIVDVVGA
jgi:DNA/RNA endonuclease YhcR with UshA esterase domain